MTTNDGSGQAHKNSGNLSIAFSPCPNDTFVFHAWVHGLVPDAPSLNVFYADIDVTNTMARRGELDVLKISYAALPHVLDRYALLPTGGALGHGCGPLLLVRGADGAIDQDPTRLSGATVAVPSEDSTGYLLFRMWAAERVPGGVGRIRVLPFREIMPAVVGGTVDAGLVIHEARFTYQRYELAKLVDLGEWWESETGAPIPLGAIIARRELDTRAITKTLRASVEYAFANREASRTYVLEHAQEMAPEVADAHIGLYVNEYSRDLGDAGYAAIDTLFRRAAASSLLPRISMATLRAG